MTPELVEPHAVEAYAPSSKITAPWSLIAVAIRRAMPLRGSTDGLPYRFSWVPGVAGVVMDPVSKMLVHALAWGAGGLLYAAGHEAVDGFSVGVSQDDGRTFSALFALCQVNGPLSFVYTGMLARSRSLHHGAAEAHEAPARRLALLAPVLERDLEPHRPLLVQ